jgi:hypothetical protein
VLLATFPVLFGKLPRAFGKLPRILFEIFSLLAYVQAPTTYPVC